MKFKKKEENKFTLHPVKYYEYINIQLIDETILQNDEN